MPIPANAETLWNQVCRGPVDVAEFDSSPDLRYLKDHELVEMVPHPHRPSPSKQLVLTQQGEVLKKISYRAIANSDLLLWMKEQGIEFPLAMLKELKEDGFIEVVSASGLYYKVL